MLLASLAPLLGLFVKLTLAAEIAVAGLSLLVVLAKIIVERIAAKKWLEATRGSIELPRVLSSGVACDVSVELRTPWRNAALEVRIPPNELFLVSPDTVALTVMPNSSEANGPLRWKGSFRLLPVKRGALTFRSIYLRIWFPGALSGWQCEVPFDEHQDREVVPKSREEENLAPFHLLQGGETPRDQGIRGSSEFHSLRPYSRGDDRRLVDWKRSSRGRGMFVRTYRPDTHQRISLVLDCGRRMNVVVGERLQMEYATDAIAQLVALSESHEDESGLFAFHHQILASLPCARHHRGELLRALQNLHPGQLETDYGLFSEWLRMHRRRSLLMFVTSISSPGNLDLLAKLLLPVRRTHLPVVIAIADEQLETFAHSAVANLQEAYVVSAAAAQLEEINKRAQSLTARGVETLVCKAEDLSLTLQSKYLELKQSGRL